METVEPTERRERRGCAGCGQRPAERSAAGSTEREANSWGEMEALWFEHTDGSAELKGSSLLQ